MIIDNHETDIIRFQKQDSLRIINLTKESSRFYKFVL